MNIGELDGVKVMLSPEAYAEVKKQKIIEENKILKEQQQEIERYKNIIDELKKDLKNLIKSSEEVENKWASEICMFALNKLKKLKGE